MEIKFYGQACFSIQDKDMTVVMDPFSDATGLKVPSLKADVVTVSHDDPAYAHVKAVQGEPRVFSWPGEYETGGVHFRLLHSFHNKPEDADQKENNIALMYFNGLRFCHLGAQGRMVSEEQVDMMGDVDVLFVPVGGGSVLSSKEAKKVVEEIEPRVVIPMLYATEGSTQGFAPLADFLKEMGSQAVEPVSSYKFKKSDLPDDNTQLVVIEPQA